MRVHSELLFDVVSSCCVSGHTESQRSKFTGTRGTCEAPRFVKGLMDMKVMDGSRVTMTVELTGTMCVLQLKVHIFLILWLVKIQ